MKTCKVLIIDGELCNLDIAEKFEIIEEGKVQKGDMTYFHGDKRFKKARREDVGNDVDDFLCVIRKINASNKRTPSTC